MPMNSSVTFRVLILVLIASVMTVSADAEDLLRAGIVGCDTSHVVAFTQLINRADATDDLAKVQVVAAQEAVGDDERPGGR